MKILLNLLHQSPARVVAPAAAPSPQPTRFASVDWLRAIGIFLVVYGHSQGVPEPLYRFIYSFHMPLFFFLSGLPLKTEKPGEGFGAFAWSTARSLIPPYLLFAAVGYAVWLLVGRHYSSHASLDTPILQPLWAIVYGSGTRSDLLQPMVLWFFPCLLTAQLLFWFVGRMTAAFKFVTVAGLAAMGLLLRDLILPWEFESALLAVPFLWLGRETGRLEASQRWGWSLSPPLLLGAAIGAAVLSQLNAGIDLRKSQVGNPFLYFLTATLMIHALYGFCRRLPQSALIERISRSTIVIFPLHPHLFWGLAAGYTLVLGQPALRQNPWLAPAASLAVVAALTLAAPPLQRLIEAMRNFSFPRRDPASLRAA